MILDIIAQTAADDYEPRPRYVIKAAGPVNRLILRGFGFAGICWPWRRIYLLPEYIDHQGLIRHELVHIDQIDRYGPVKFTALYLWYALTRGYWRNPLELEAYRRAHE